VDVAFANADAFWVTCLNIAGAFWATCLDIVDTAPVTSFPVVLAPAISVAARFAVPISDLHLTQTTCSGLSAVLH